MSGMKLMEKYWLPWLVGMPAETSFAICIALSTFQLLLIWFYLPLPIFRLFHFWWNFWTPSQTKVEPSKFWEKGIVIQRPLFSELRLLMEVDLFPKRLEGNKSFLSPFRRYQLWLLLLELSTASVFVQICAKSIQKSTRGNFVASSGSIRLSTTRSEDEYLKLLV